MKSPVIITGFHRSGTSAVARAFHSAGVVLGTDLIGAEPANPYGHFEDVEVVALHDALLASEGLTWKSTDPVANRAPIAQAIERYRSERPPAQHWGVKDPRICLFLHEWVEVLPDASVVFVVRPPGPSIASLHRRHARRHVFSEGIDPSDLEFWRDPDLGLKLWCHYHEQALPTLTTHPHTTIIDYADPDGADKLITAELTRQALDPDRSTPLDRELGLIATIDVYDSSLIDRARSLWATLTAST